MEEVHQLLLIVGLACGRFILTLVDCIAAIQYPTCAHACNLPLPTRTECQGLLSSAAILNLFEVCALGLFFYLRYESGSWSYREYYRASLLLIAASLLLRLAAVCLGCGDLHGNRAGRAVPSRNAPAVAARGLAAPPRRANGSCG